MTDRELLEAAAMAAGKPAPMMIEQRGLSWGSGWWNPLTDDGDALRLAVALGICVYGQARNDGPFTEAYSPSMDDLPSVWVPHCGDPYAATRRAIVQAAALMAASEQQVNAKSAS